MVERMITQMEKVIPDFRELIIDQVVFTQQYFDKPFNATEGDFSLGLLHPGQMFGDRPGSRLGWRPRDPAREPLHGRRCLPPRPRRDLLPGMNGARIVLEKLGGAKEEAAE